MNELFDSLVISSAGLLAGMAVFSTAVFAMHALRYRQMLYFGWTSVSVGTFILALLQSKMVQHPMLFITNLSFVMGLLLILRHDWKWHHRI